MNYYDELLTNLSRLMEDKQYDEAKSIIMNELNLVYVPKDVEEKLNEYLTIINQETRVVNILSDEDINDYLLLDYEHQLIACNELGKRNLRDYIDICDGFLSNKNGYENAKALLIDSLIRQEISYPFKYVNDCSLIEFNPRNLRVIEETDGYIEASRIINDNYLKDPSKANIGIELLFKEALLALPNQIDGRIVAEKIINYIDDAFSAK